MKKNLTIKLSSLLSLFPVPCSLFPLLLSLLIVLSCEQPFKAGLGPIIDLQDPTIVLESPRAGAFIHGVREFRGSAGDDYKLVSAWFHISNYPYEELPLAMLPDSEKQRIGLTGNYYRITPDAQRTDRNWTWSFKIDTLELNSYGERKFPDGYLKIRLLAIDHVTKYVLTDEIVFNVKNSPPLITLDAPPVQEGDTDYDLGDHSLNDNFLTKYNTSQIKPVTFKRTVTPKSDLQGMISDNEGIYRGRQMMVVIAEDGDPISDINGNPILDSENKVKVDKDGNPKTPKLDEYGNKVIVELFPPQFRFWEVYFDGAKPLDKNGVEVEKAYPAGVIPPYDDANVPWLSFREEGTIIDTGVNSLAFFYTVPDASGRHFAFQVRAQSTDVLQSATVYPQDYIPDFEEKDDDFKNENSYVLILVSEYQEDPVVTLYELEDIWGEDSFKGYDGDLAQYEPLPGPTDEPDKSDWEHGKHPYIDKTPVSKNGAFTLRVKTSHSGGIASAKVYWEKSDKSQKGRFIWDPVDRPYTGWIGAIPSKSAHYSTWGLNEPKGDTRVRSFVFTYTDLNPKGANTFATAPNDRLPNDDEFLNNVMGDIRRMSKLQRYTGGVSGQAGLDGKPYTFHDLPEDMGNWQDVYKLDDGKYNIYVYATSNSGAISKPYRVELSIDRRKPSIALNYIEGSAGEIKNAAGERENTVNGVIQPWFILSDSQPTDTGFREGTSDYFLIPPSSKDHYPEQAYILIKESERDALEKHFAIGKYLDETKNIWPNFTGNLGGYLVAPSIPDVSVVSKYGVVIESACRFRTSKIYQGIPQEKPLADGIAPPPPPGTINPEDAQGEVLDNGAYRLYVFARDNAFNVGSASWPIIVDHTTDYPTFDFSIGSTKVEVTEPDSAYDFGRDKYAAGLPYEKSFITKDGIRPMFTANSGIQVRIRDDDGLDLGVKDGDPSNVKVTFIGSYPDELSNYEVKPYTDPGRLMNLADLGDDVVKQAFPPADKKGEYVKDVRGNITYDMLLRLLKHNTIYGVPPDASTIPDGLYRVGISVSDDSDAKLIMEPPYTPTKDPREADAVTIKYMPIPIPDVTPKPTTQEYTEYFWIAVDNFYPVVDITSKYETNIIQPEETKDMNGTVSDENGPITLVSWRVKNGNTIESEMGKDPLRPDSPTIVISPLTPATPLYDGKKWNYNFSYKLKMNGRDYGSYDFEVTFRDRFGKETTASQRFSVDNDPPKLSLIRKIETFSRNFEDVTLTGVQVADADTNKERLAVKTVNFMINATDSNGIKGVRWWLLPADTGSVASPGDGYFVDGGTVSEYDAFPAKLAAYKEPGVYYADGSNGFTKGIYGVVDVANRKFTIAFDSRRMPQPNGEYRLHIIAEDNAGNKSLGTEVDGKFTHVFQEVFFLQIEDKPYFAGNIVKESGKPDVFIPGGGISPGEAITGTGWPQENGHDKEMPVLGGVPVIRGTIWENNGFFGSDKLDSFWNGSITIWFSKTEAAAKNIDSDWENLVKAGSDIPDYEKKVIPNDVPAGNKTGLGMQGRNISMAIELPTLFSDLFKTITDGKKRYIIKAEDSPVNKLKYHEYTGAPLPLATYNSLDGNASKMGKDKDGVRNPNVSDAENEGIREYNYKQYAFVYDAIPPRVVIDSPVKKPVQTYGRSSDIILGGYISDANLEKTDAGDYYFDYYLNNDTRKTFILKPMTGVDLSNPTAPGTIPAPPDDSVITSGQHIYAITKDPADGKVTVYFRIKTSDLSSATGIIPVSRFNELPQGQHTLTLWAADKSGKEGADFVDFIKDTEPPNITFTNLTPENRLYNEDNPSKVDKPVPNVFTSGWWGKSRAERQTLLFASVPDPAPATTVSYKLPLTTITYIKDTTVPVLRGTISDLVSIIDLGPTAGNTNPDVGTGDVNHDDSKFRYWIDNEYKLDNYGQPTTTGRYLALIDGAGTKNVRWTINLTSDGTLNGTPLYDGVHTIVLTAEDSAHIPIPESKCYMIAFRIDSGDPRSITKDNRTNDEKNTVYGNVTYQNPGSTSMFTLDVEADDANLDRVELNIVNTTTGKAEPKVTFDPKTNSAGWTYNHSGIAPAVSPAWLQPPLYTSGPNLGTLTEDYILFKGTYPVPKSLFTDSGKYEVTVAAYDLAKNKSEEFKFSFTYDKDAPKIEFTNPSDDNKNKADTWKPENFIYLKEPSLAPNPEKLPTGEKNDNYDAAKYANINRLTSEALRIQGNVKDVIIVKKEGKDDEEVPLSAIRDVQSRVEKWNWLTGAWVLVPEPGQTTDGWKALGDYSENTQTQISWTKNLLGQNTGDLDLRSDTTDITTAEGLYRIRIRAKDASILTIPPGTNDWNITTGQGNPVISDYQYFYFDRTNPTLEITSINGSTTSMDTYYSNPGKFTFKGTVTDNNRFAKVEVKFEVGTVGTPGYTVYTKNATMSRYVFTATPEKPTDPDYNASDPATPTLNIGGKKQNWEAEFDDAGALPDGKYKVTVTVYDMTGRSTSQTKSFILDSTAPTLKFTLPAKIQNKGYGDDSENKKPTPWTAAANGFASTMVQGGLTAVITGETADKVGPGGESGSESGIDQMWFHLGFIDGVTYNTTNPFPSKDAIEAWEKTLIGRHAPTGTNVAALTVKERNEWMNKIAEYRATSNTDDKGNAWFKLGGTLKPTGFIINNPNIYDWRFEIPDKIDTIPTDDNRFDYNDSNITAGTQIGGLKLYGNTITVKGRKYYINPPTAPDNIVRQMVRSVDGQPGGVYRLPLWVRLTDVAGNVEYYCHDIWIDMNGDIPSTSIESPSNGTRYNARGGAISVDGVARSNTSVYDVIFRVFADAVTDTNLDGIQTLVNGTLQPTNTNKTIGTNGMPNVANIVRITGYNPADAASVLRLDPEYRPAPGASWNWQKASLTLPGGSGEPLIPWSIMLNAEDQLTGLIGDKGFASSAGGTKDMIRIWLEVFVFNGEGSPIRSSIYPDDNLNTAGGALYGTPNNVEPFYPGPKPYVKAFYIKTGAVAITHPNVGTWNGGTTATPTRHNNFNWNAESNQNQGGGGYGGAGTEMRSKQFAFSATLDPNPNGNSTSALGEVAYRLKLDGGSYSGWTTVWKTGDTAITATTPFYKDGAGISVRTTGTVTPARTRYWFDYAIDSKPTGGLASGHAALPNNVNWADTGGTITLQVRMKDNASPPNEAEQTIQVAVDNFAPLRDKNYTTNPKVAGSNVNFMGRVYDYATTPPMNTEYTPRKLERVTVWFTKTVGGVTRYVNMNGANGKPVPVAELPTAVPNPRTIDVYQNRDAAVVGGGVNDAVTSITLSTTSPGTVTNNFSYPGLGGKDPYNADYVRDITQATGQPQYKMLWSPVNSALYDVRWQLTLDSTLLPDGELTLHYIVVDAAGNASYYTQTGISVRNNYPEITRITLYTDNNGQGAQYTMDAEQGYTINDYRSKMFANYTDTADKPKSDTTGYLNSGFISKNKYIGFKVETDKGNRPLSFRLQHVTRQRVTLDATTLDQMVTDRKATPSATTINLYTIAWHGNYTPQKWKALGVPIDNNPNPTLGTHFVFNPVNIEDPAKDFNVADAVGTAEVWKYTAVVTRTPDITNQGAPNSTDTVVYGEPTNDFRFYGDPHFAVSGAGRINEFDGSHPTIGDTKEDDPAKTAFFLIRVWDSISTAGGADDMLYDALVVGMNVYLSDKNPPVVRLYDLNPYTETAVIEGNKNQTIKDAAYPQAIGGNIVRGGLYNDGTARAMVRSGFIDPRVSSTALDPKNGLWFKDVVVGSPWQLINGSEPPASNLKVAGDTVANGAPNDKVSGKIILRGLAWDDQLVKTITLNLNGTSTPILQLDETSPEGSPTRGKMVATAGNTNSAFVVEELHWKTGHSVEWAYIWDTTATSPGTATVTVSATDRNGPNPSATTPITVDGPNAYHNSVTVDIVPYITGFERSAKFTTKRSLQGWYSFYQGETDIKVKGYNFGSTTGTMTLGGTTITPTGNTSTERTFSIPAGASSGAITLTTSVAAYNNYTLTASGITGKSWNREFNSYTPGSDLWINKHYAHIWRTKDDNGTPRTYIGGKPENSSGLNHPGMALEYLGGNPGTLHGTWAVYGSANVFYGTNGSDNNNNFFSLNGNGTLAQMPGEPFSTPDISIYNGGGSDAANVGYTHQPDGRSILLVKSNVTTYSHHTDVANVNIIQASTVYGSTQRWQNIRISKAAANTSTSEANVGRIYMTAYNADFKSLWYGSRNNNNNTTMIIDGGSVTGISSIGASGAVANAGEFSAVDYDSTGPIIAYYDATNDTVRVALGANNNPGTGDWTRRNLLPATGAGSELYRGSGKYISIKVDKANGIHLSFFNSNNNTVVYYYAAGRANIGTAPNGTTIKCHAVDSVVSGGNWSDISVDNDGNPWIVYADSSRTNNYDGARIAYKGAFTRTLADPVSKSDITGWEALSMPAEYTVGNDRLNLEAWPANGGPITGGPGWNAAVGYASDMFRVGYFIKPAVPSGF